MALETHHFQSIHSELNVAPGTFDTNLPGGGCGCTNLTAQDVTSQPGTAKCLFSGEAVVGL